MIQDKNHLHDALGIAELLGRLSDGSISDQEKETLLSWMAEKEEHRKLLESFGDPALVMEDIKRREGLQADFFWEEVQEATRTLARRKKARSVYLVVTAAAAAVLFWLIPGGVDYFKRLSGHASKETQHNLAAATEILPGGEKAELVMDNGGGVLLDSHTDTAILGGTIRAHKGTLSYARANADHVNVSYHILKTPRGGQYHVQLEDGTDVWLNNASTIRFPTRFDGKERTVEVQGEAYFEVAPRPRQPFVVTANSGMKIQVLGTAFNIQAYADQKTIRTTLVSGLVRVLNGDQSQLLRPGYVASSSAGNTQIEIAEANIQAATAWKNGCFYFRDTPIPDLMEQLSRWYDIEVTYGPGFASNAAFTGKVRRNVPISEVLTMLERVGVAHFEVRGRTVKVLP